MCTIFAIFGCNLFRYQDTVSDREVDSTLVCGLVVSGRCKEITIAIEAVLGNLFCAIVGVVVTNQHIAVLTHCKVINRCSVADACKAHKDQS